MKAELIEKLSKLDNEEFIKFINALVDGFLKKTE